MHPSAFSTSQSANAWCAPPTIAPTAIRRNSYPLQFHEIGTQLPCEVWIALPEAIVA